MPALIVDTASSFSIGENVHLNMKSENFTSTLVMKLGVFSFGKTNPIDSSTELSYERKILNSSMPFVRAFFSVCLYVCETTSTVIMGKHCHLC